LGSRGSKLGFWGEDWEFPRGNNLNRETCSGATRQASCSVADPFVLGVPGYGGRSRWFQTDLFDVIKCI